MERRDQLGAAELVDPSAQPRDRILRAKQRLRGERSERHDHLRRDDIDLAKQERFARLDFVRLGVAVAGRTALDDVRDVDLVARQPDGFDDLREQLTGAPHEWNALDVFVSAGRLADEHQVRISVADAENDLAPAERVQLAAAAVFAEVGPDGGQRVTGRAARSG